ncbi:CDP-alcohol phosphatidyltransferase family protein [Candidatus Berkelbacteria bacterium]|nr:CDP-alcohol phosphatidyltransferase family protein [Candidatus Berkelbacteria bacterium]
MNNRSSKLIFVNFLTGLRFVFAGLALIYYQNLTLVTWFIIGAFLTDAFDGFLARGWQVTSKFGKKLDYNADRIFFICLLIFMLLRNDTFPTWLPIAIATGSTALAIVSAEKSKKYFQPKTWATIGLIYFVVIVFFWLSLISYLAWLSLNNPFNWIVIILTTTGSIFALSRYSINLIKWRQKYLKELKID